jgi:hypothetical protein
MRPKHTRFATLAAATLVTTTALVGGSVAPANAGTYGGGDSHKVEKLTVTKTAATSLTRTYKWTIDKKVDPYKLVLKKRKTATANYSVTVAATPTDSAWKVTGKITIKNPSNHHSAKITNVTDVLQPGSIAATVDCGVTYPYRLAAGGTLTCDYSASLPDATSRTNVATVTTSDWSKVKGASSASVPVVFGPATTVTLVDDRVKVWDSYKGFLGEVSASQAPKTFTYTRTFGPFYKHGFFKVKNVAGFKTDDTGTKGYDTAWVKIIVLKKHHHRYGDHHDDHDRY